MDKEFAIDGDEELKALVESAEPGEEIVLTRAGKAVAKVVPTPAPFDRQSALDAAESIRASRFTLGPDLTIKDLINEGRKY